MNYRIEQLAAVSGVRAETIRFYQGRGLLAPPRRSGRIAYYGEEHRKRLARIRSLLDQGLTLALIKRVLDGGAKGARVEPLVDALAREKVGGRTYSRSEFALATGMPEALVASIQLAGLFEPIRIENEDRFSEADVAMARAALRILGAGFPLDELLALAVQHANATRELAERAIELFDRHVRARAPADGDSVEAAFRELLPEATRLVALYFQRTLVSRALARLRGRGESEALARAVAATESADLEVAWR
ncbi:MAG TPA: helix-turn-helix domain-containing protein [Myxococcota bacterium]|nr:helix-turn-helix domain-containing protein [Myxococcota bacterium]